MTALHKSSTNVASIITPVDGDLDGLARLVRSLIAQTYPYWQMIIVSDDSRCYKSALAQLGIEDPRLRFLWTPRPGSGLDVARNIGTQYATGNYIAPLETSSVCHPERLEIMVGMAREHGICGSNVRRHAARGSGGMDSNSLGPAGDGVRWLPLHGHIDLPLPDAYVVARELLLQRSMGTLAGRPQLNPQRVPDGTPVPFIEAVLQDHYCPNPQ